MELTTLLETKRLAKPASIESIVRLWNASAPRDPISTRRFRDLFILDPNFDPAGLCLATEDGRLVGACYTVRRLTPLYGIDREQTSGWMPFLLVHPAQRRKGIARRLLENQLRWLHSTGVQTTYFSSYTPNYFLPGLDADAYPEGAACLGAAGFRTDYVAVAMDRSLVNHRVPPEVRAQATELTERGYLIRVAEENDLVELIAFARDQFNPDWGRAIREAVAAGLPLERIVLVREPTGRLVGWAMHGTYENTTDRFGPFGVLEECRGTGLGKILLHFTMERMKAESAHSAWFLWTDETSAAGHLYRKTGFEITRRFQVLSHQRKASTR